MAMVEGGLPHLARSPSAHVGLPAARPTNGRWKAEDYNFDPYQLQAVPAANGSRPSRHIKAKAVDAAGGSSEGAAGGSAPSDGVTQHAKRKPGRQRRTSVLCQVGWPGDSCRVAGWRRGRPGLAGTAPVALPFPLAMPAVRHVCMGGH